MCKTSVLVCTYAEILIKVILNENEAGAHAYMTTRLIMNVYLSRPFHFTNSNFCRVDTHHQQYLNIREIAQAPVKILHIKDEGFSYPSGRHANNNDNSINAVH